MLGTNGKNDADNSKIEATIEKDNNSQKSELEKETIETVNNKPSISGSIKTKIKQNEYFTYTPYAKDLDNDKLLFSIINQPDWVVFDSRTGSITGRPNNSDVGITEDIIITVIDSHGQKASLQPFDLEVVNLNDAPFISGSPEITARSDSLYKFTPNIKDLDLDIGQDKLSFSIKNKPNWAIFNKKTGQLSGRPKELQIWGACY